MRMSGVGVQIRGPFDKNAILAPQQVIVFVNIRICVRHPFDLKVLIKGIPFTLKFQHNLVKIKYLNFVAVLLI